MIPELLAFDLDKTALNDDGSVNINNLIALHQLKNMGITNVITTGRTYYEIPYALRECTDIDYIIFSDGAVTVKADAGIIRSRMLTPCDCKKLRDILSGYDTMNEVYTMGHPYASIDCLNEEAMEHFRIEKEYRPVIMSTRVPCLETFKLTEKNGAEILNIFFADENERTKFMFECSILQSEIAFTYSMQSNIEVMARTASKGRALKALAQSLDIDMVNVCAVGDSSNDISMLSICGRPYTPSNASEAVRQYATALNASNNDGVIDDIQKILAKEKAEIKFYEMSCS